MASSAAAASASASSASSARRKFVLDVSEWVQGSALDCSKAKVNVVLTFQVNCPGCFMYALPTIIALAKDKSIVDAGVNFGVVGTAFEDYEFNNLDNLKALLTSGTIVGETRKFYASQGATKCPLEFDGLRVAFDNVMKVTKDNVDSLVPAQFAHLLQQAGGSLPPGVPEDLVKGRVRSFLLQQGRWAATFGGNGMQGTPTWALLDSSGKAIEQWVGHRSLADTAATIVKALAGEGVDTSALAKSSTKAK